MSSKLVTSEARHDGGSEEDILSSIRQGISRYNPDGDIKLIPPGVLPSRDEGYFLSVKQVPTCLSLRSTGNATVKAQYQDMRKGGFPLETYSEDSGTWCTIPELTRPTLSQSGLSTVLSFMEGQAPIPPAETPDVWVKPKKSFPRIRMAYSDPWKIFSAISCSGTFGLEMPKVHVWFGDAKRLQDHLVVPSLKGVTTWNAKKRNKIQFIHISSLDTKMEILMKHTHWGYKLSLMRKSENSRNRRFADRLYKSIKCFLQGKGDPHWSKEELRKLGQRAPLSNASFRAERLIEVLKTCDGIFMTRFMARPEELWSWEKFDNHTLWYLSHLLKDEFYDMVLPVDFDLENHPIRYSQLKRVRKEIKQVGHRPTGLDLSKLDTSVYPYWLRDHAETFNRIRKIKKLEYASRISYLTQTRAAGTPPSILVLKTKLKTLQVMSSVPSQMTRTRANLMKGALEDVYNNIPPEAFTGMSTKASITVTSSSCWEFTRKEGGTVEALRDVLNLATSGQKCRILDLETGEVIRYATLDEITHGEYIFWKSLEVVLGTPVENLREVKLVVVSEPGKGRSVTKAHACLKIVLDVVNKICAIPLERGISSSSSGMGKANHDWNLFKELFKAPYREFVFDGKPTEEELDNHTMRRVCYKDVYILSTDYETATDYLEHSVAKIIGVSWMNQCGIPKILQGIVVGVCYHPRKIFFEGTGPLKNIGQTDGENSSRFVWSSRGVLMGDPLTKVVLHFVNIIVRTIASKITNPESYLLRGLDKPMVCSSSFREVLTAKLEPP